jgi:hypothetical protein
MERVSETGRTTTFHQDRPRLLQPNETTEISTNINTNTNTTSDNNNTTTVTTKVKVNNSRTCPSSCIARTCTIRDIETMEAVPRMLLLPRSILLRSVLMRSSLLPIQSIMLPLDR